MSGSTVGRELLEWAGNLELLVDNLQKKKKKKSWSIIKDTMMRGCVRASKQGLWIFTAKLSKAISHQISVTQSLSTWVLLSTFDVSKQLLHSPYQT